MSFCFQDDAFATESQPDSLCDRAPSYTYICFFMETPRDQVSRVTQVSHFVAASCNLLVVARRRRCRCDSAAAAISCHAQEAGESQLCSRVPQLTQPQALWLLFVGSRDPRGQRAREADAKQAQLALELRRQRSALMRPANAPTRPTSAPRRRPSSSRAQPRGGDDAQLKTQLEAEVQNPKAQGLTRRIWRTSAWPSALAAPRNALSSSFSRAANERVLAQRPRLLTLAHIARAGFRYCIIASGATAGCATTSTAAAADGHQRPFCVPEGAPIWAR